MTDSVLIRDDREFQCLASSVGVVLANTDPPETILDVGGIDTVILAGDESPVGVQCLFVGVLKDISIDPLMEASKEVCEADSSIDLSPLHTGP